jgi:hypothetical protein
MFRQPFPSPCGNIVTFGESQGKAARETGVLLYCGNSLADPDANGSTTTPKTWCVKLKDACIPCCCPANDKDPRLKDGVWMAVVGAVGKLAQIQD